MRQEVRAEIERMWAEAERLKAELRAEVEKTREELWAEMERRGKDFIKWVISVAVA